MKKLMLLVVIITLALTFYGQELQYEAVAINIEVPVRVFKGNTFIDNLTIEDFEVYEDGKLQKIEAVYLIKKTNIEREEADMDKEEARKKFAPDVSRYFVLAFILSEYLPKVRDAIDYFFDQVYFPGDTLNVVTPLKTYNLKRNSLDKVPKEVIKKQLKEKLRKDIVMGNSEYISLIEELEESVRAGDVEKYVMALTRLGQIRYIDKEKLEDFAKILKAKEGQKYVFLFYQQESIPQLESSIDLGNFNPYRMRAMNVATGNFNEFFREVSLDVDSVKQAFSDSSIATHFLYITKSLRDRIDVTRMESLKGMRFVEKSGDIYEAFNKIAQVTGGITESSANIFSIFKKAVDASENYYLLYYAPKNYKEDGKFRNIKVRVKNKKYQITHRAGYIAN